MTRLEHEALEFALYWYILVLPCAPHLNNCAYKWRIDAPASEGMMFALPCACSTIDVLRMIRVHHFCSLRDSSKIIQLTRESVKTNLSKVNALLTQTLVCFMFSPACYKESINDCKGHVSVVSGLHQVQTKAHTLLILYFSSSWWFLKEQSKCRVV